MSEPRGEVGDRLRLSLEEYRELVESLNDVVFITDTAGKLTYLSSAVEAFLGYRPEELIGDGFEEYIHPEDRDATMENFRNLVSGQSHRPGDCRVRHKDGSWHWVRSHSSPIRRDGVVVGRQGVLVDISELKETQERLVRSRTALEERVRERTETLEAANRALEERIEDHKRAEEALRRSEEKYRNLLENMHDVIFRLDAEGRITYVSPSAEAFLQEPPDWLLGRSFTSVLHPEDVELARSNFRRVLQSGTAESQYRIRNRAGRYFWARSSTHPLTDQQGESVLQGRLVDITAQKKAEDALRQSEAKYRELIENLSDTVYRVDARGQIVFVSQAVESILGYPPEELIGSHIQRVFHPDDVSRVRERFRRILGGVSAEEEYRMLHRSGEVRWVRTSSRPIREGDRVMGVQGILTSIDQRKRAEERIRQLTIAVEQSTEGIAIADLQGVLLFVNSHWARMHGYETGEELVGESLSLFHTEEQLRSDVIPCNREVLVQGFHRGEMGHRRKDGSIFPTLMTTTLLKDEQEEPIALCGIARDISERKKIEEQRDRLIFELEAKNAELERFAYTVSHDLKSPLITINGYLSLLDEEVEQGDSERLKADIRRIADAVDQMQILLEDVLELSRIGQQEISLEEVALHDLAMEVIDLLGGRITEAGVEVRVQEDLPTVIGDPVRLRQLLQNLLENAVKFMGDQPEPRVEIRARRQDGETVVCIRDNGIGIDASHQQQIFDLFTALSPDTPGTGIGLALAKRIVEQHGGRIWVESEGEGKGSSFCFTFIT